MHASGEGRSHLLLSRAAAPPGRKMAVGGEQEGAVAAAVVVPGRVLVVHDQARHVGRRLHAHHCSVPAALLAVCAPRLIYVDWRMSILEKERTARGQTLLLKMLPQAVSRHAALSMCCMLSSIRRL